jgi:hypothetical protein
MGLLSAAVISSVLASWRIYIPTWLTNDGILQRMLRNLMPLLCLGVALLSFGTMSRSILCAQGRTPLATAITGIGSLCITLPLASFSTFYFNYNMQGLAASLIIGYASSGFFNSLLMLTSDWAKISKTVRKRTKQLEETMRETPSAQEVGKDGIFTTQEDDVRDKNYESFDFDELPKDGKSVVCRHIVTFFALWYICD